MLLHQKERASRIGRVPSRAAVLEKLYDRVRSRIGLRGSTAASFGPDQAEEQVPHPLLRRLLQSDPSMEALLGSAPAHIALGASEHAPFFVTSTRLLVLPPALLDSTGALAAAARWGLEASFLLGAGLTSARQARDAASAVLRHGAALIESLGEFDRQLLLDLLPDQIAAELADGAEIEPADALLAWQVSRIESFDASRLDGPRLQTPGSAGELALPMELVLVAGGDSRLAINPTTGMNRYGTVPRPRPEAVHFSSSTASSISDYGFMMGDMLRRELLFAQIEKQISSRDLRRRATDAVEAELLALLGLDPSEADATLAASGSDTELLAVMMALASGEQPLMNILIAPEESGRAVAMAGAGCFFDDVAASGAPVRKGQMAWPRHEIDVTRVAIRTHSGEPRPMRDIEAETRELCASALANGQRILLHALPASKTGLRAPSDEALARIVAMAPDRIDVVVDACQMRTPPRSIGAWVKRGWMVQISGSKFFTGPPFSGALVFPRRYRACVERIGELCAAAPGVTRPADWNQWWRDRLPPTSTAAAPSFGLIFRWLPALAEAHLLRALPDELCVYAFERFRQALEQRLAASPYLVPITPPDEAGDDEEQRERDPTDLSTQSIVSFGVGVDDGAGGRRILDEAECQKLFELLNIDVSGLLSGLGPIERVQAKQGAHIGQPVTLCAGEDSEVTVLRLVVGARFFTIVGYGGGGDIEPALVSEIADALRAIDKLDLLASRWAEIAAAAA
jgi:hypothetical protein